MASKTRPGWGHWRGRAISIPDHCQRRPAVMGGSRTHGSIGEDGVHEQGRAKTGLSGIAPDKVIEEQVFLEDAGPGVLILEVNSQQPGYEPRVGGYRSPGGCPDRGQARINDVCGMVGHLVDVFVWGWSEQSRWCP